MFFVFYELTIADGKRLPGTAIWSIAGLFAGTLFIGSVAMLPLGKGGARAPMLGWIVAFLAVTYIGMLPLLAD
jgi:hypothetical protein